MNDLKWRLQQDPVGVCQVTLFFSFPKKLIEVIHKKYTNARI